MSSPADFYKSLPPVCRAFGTICVLTTAGYHLGLVNPAKLSLDWPFILYKFQLWRLVTNFFWLGPFSLSFGWHILMIARYGVQLERGSYAKRTADFVWMIMSSVGVLLILHLISFLVGSTLYLYAMGSVIVFEMMYLWSREFPTTKVNFFGLVQLQGFYLPWAFVVANTFFGGSVVGDLLGIFVGHAYYFLNTLYPRQSGRQLLKTPLWVHKLVARWAEAGPQHMSPVPPPTTSSAFTGRSYRLNRD